MNPFKKKKGPRAELEEAQKETQEVMERTPKIEKLRADLQNHLKDNHFGPRLYAQMVENWE